jgi:hypothetical protein
LFDYLVKNYNNPTNPYLKAAKFLRGELKWGNFLGFF